MPAKTNNERQYLLPFPCHTKTCIFSSCKQEQLPKSQNIHYTGSPVRYFKPFSSRLCQSANNCYTAPTVLPPLNLITSSTNLSCSDFHCCKQVLFSLLQLNKTCYKINSTQLMFRKGLKHRNSLCLNSCPAMMFQSILLFQQCQQPCY